MLKVSIVTISFNQAAFLERTLLSVLDQDYPDIEYIVVDPGSSDGSRDIIERYRQRLSTVIYEPDKGAADGLNKGFAASTGDVLGFLNSDDLLFPDAVSAAVNALAKHSDVDVVSGHAKIIDPNDFVLRLAYSDRMSVRNYVYGAVALIQPSTFFRRSAYLRVGGFNVDNRATWDGELFLEMARAGSRFCIDDKIWSGYRLHNASITSSKNMQGAATALRNEMFLRVMGRSPTRIDRYIGRGLRTYKHLLNRRDTVERILRGPIYGRRVEE